MTNIKEIQDKIENLQNQINSAIAQGEFVPGVAQWRKELKELLKELKEIEYTYE